MKKIMMMSIYAILFLSVNSVLAQTPVLEGVYGGDKKTEKKYESFLVDGPEATYDIPAGTAFEQCKYLAEKCTNGEKFNAELFKNSLKKLDTTSLEVKQFKTWGYIFIIDTFNRITEKELGVFITKTKKYNLEKDVYTMDAGNSSVTLYTIGGIPLLLIANNKKQSFQYSDSETATYTVTLIPGLFTKTTTKFRSIMVK